jgi:hypothetical protein
MSESLASAAPSTDAGLLTSTSVSLQQASSLYSPAHGKFVFRDRSWQLSQLLPVTFSKIIPLEAFCCA